MDNPDDPQPDDQTAQRPSDRPISSAALFQGQQHVLIEHDGEIYRLVLTRNNKLLLQK